MTRRVAITAAGVVTSLGIGKHPHIAAFTSGVHGLKQPRHLLTRHADELLAGEIDMSNDELAMLNGLPPGDNGYTRTALLCLTGLKDLFEHTEQQMVSRSRHAFINASTVGGMSTMEDIYLDLIGDNTPPHLLKYVNTLDCSQSTEMAARHFGLFQNLATISTACSSSANAILMGARMIEHDLADVAICGGADALCKYTVNGFGSLKNISPHLCRPFSNNRDGLSLGEAAGYILLESEAHALEREASILGYVAGYANTNDACHPTAPRADGEGAERTMRRALAKAALQPEDINYLNAHGTATSNNDLAEGLAIQKVFGQNLPFSSTKPFTGHTLAAAGVIEAIFTLWCVHDGFIIPNLNFTEPMPELNIIPVTDWNENLSINHAISNSFGFGGTNVSLVFSKK